MRTRTQLASLFALPFALLAGQAQAVSHDLATSTPTTADKSAVASAKAGTVGVEQQRLAQLVGTWKVTQSFWTRGKPTPQVDTGTATYAMVLGGRHLRQELRIDSSAKPFEALGYIGYDNLSGRYYSSWMDINFTGVIMAYGDYDAATRTYMFRGTLPGPAASEAIPLRGELKVIDADHFVYDFHERHDGAEALAVRLDYTRQD